MRGKRVWSTAHEKDFAKVFEALSVKYGAWNVWVDFVTTMAIALSNALEPDKKILSSRAEQYESIQKKYTTEGREQLEELAKITIAAYEFNPRQDFLGELYMNMDFGSSWHGQFFTPWNISFMMAKMTSSSGCAQQMEKGYISVCDPCCGAGCMLIAAAAAYQGDSEQRTYQNDVLFVGQDVDRVVALMCYIQLSVLGCAGYVAIGNSLTNSVEGHDLFPTIGEGGELWFTPMWNSPVWVMRRFNCLYECSEFHRIEEEETTDVKPA